MTAAPVDMGPGPTPHYVRPRLPDLPASTKRADVEDLARRTVQEHGGRRHHAWRTLVAQAEDAEAERRRAEDAGDLEAREAAHVRAMTSRLAARRLRPLGLPE